MIAAPVPVTRTVVLLEFAEVVDAKDFAGQAWRARALCTGTDPDWWHPHKGGNTREQVRTCEACPVRVECLDYALSHYEKFGIWGGLSEKARLQVRREGWSAAEAVERLSR